MNNSSGIEIRPMRPEDIPAGMDLCRAANWNQLEDDWRVFLEMEGAAALLAVRDGLPVGTAAFLRYGPRFSWLAMMLVDPRHRRAGIGGQLMEAALAALAGETCVRLDATPAGEPLYRRFQFVEEYHLVRLRGTFRAENLPPADAGVRPMTRRDLDSVLALDREVFGGNRAALLESIYVRAPQYAWLAGGDGAPRGFAFGRPGYLYEHLGPVVARDIETAKRLVAGCLASQTAREFVIDAPTWDQEWKAWLESAGLAAERPFLRMRLGPYDHPGEHRLLFAIAGPEFG